MRERDQLRCTCRSGWWTPAASTPTVRSKPSRSTTRTTASCTRGSLLPVGSAISLKSIRDLTISVGVNLRRAKDSEPEPVVAEPVARAGTTDPAPDSTSHSARDAAQQAARDAAQQAARDAAPHVARDATPGSAQDAAPQAARDATPHAALDAVAAILRVLRDTAGSDSEAASRLEAWARHILVLAAPPGSGDAVCLSRDWPGLSSHVVAYVRDDRAAVSRSIGDLQDAVWLVIEGLSEAIVGDATSDAFAVSQLDRLRAAVGGSASELKATALETVHRLSEIIDEKSTRQHELARELGERVDILKGELEDTRREADIDPLTKLWNRGVFQRELPRAVQVATLLNEPACLAMVDLDHFKEINDVHGHTTGDRALEAVASALVRSFPRRWDAVTRFGGDEFAVILRGATAAEGGRLAQRLLAAVRQLEVPGPRETVKVTVSIGVAQARPGEAADSWFTRADRALYKAKAIGRNCVALAADESTDCSPVGA